MYKLLSILLVFLQIECAATVVFRTIFINAGQLDGTNGPIPSLAYNEGLTFDGTSAILQVASSDTLLLTIWNNDTVPHGFAVRNTSVLVINIAPGSSESVSINLASTGAYVYYDPMEWGAYLGAAGLLQVGYECSNSFYWNIHEHHTEWNDSLALGIEPVSEFLPDHFTINGYDYPASQSDTLAVITGNVTDTLCVYIVNTGMMSHSIHSHGFHGMILYSSKYPTHVGREKDSFPILPFETLIIRFVPHQPGLYPIHDHNLVATTSGGNYPGGMISIFDIQP